MRNVHGLKRNLISFDTLDVLGFYYKAQNGCLDVYKDESLILCSTKKNDLCVNGCYVDSDKNI